MQTPPLMKKPNRYTNNISIPTLKKRCIETLNLCRNTSLTNEEIANIIFAEKTSDKKESNISNTPGLITYIDHYDIMKEGLW